MNEMEGNVQTTDAGANAQNSNEVNQATLETGTQEIKTAVGSEVNAEKEAIAPAYQPDYKFKSYDKEYEIDEFLRGVIKDQETEKKVKSIYSKAYGFDGLKEKHAKFREEFDGYRGKTEPVMKSLEKISELYNRGDLDGFFSAIKVPYNVLQDYVAKKLQYQELTPEQQRAYDEYTTQQRRAYETENQLSQMQKMYDGMAVQTRTMELNQVLNTPEVKEIQKSFDEAHGQGAFQREVISRGVAITKTKGIDPSAEEVVQEVVKFVKPFLTKPGQVNGQQMITAPDKKPVIPNVAGKSVSPVKKIPTSIADLRKIAAEYSAQSED